MSCLRGAQLQAQNIKEISIMLGLTIHTTADDILKRLSFLTLGLIVTDAHFNKGGSLSFEPVISRIGRPRVSWVHNVYEQMSFRHAY